MRLAPEPPKAMLASGIRAVLDDEAARVRLPGAVSASPTVKGTAGVEVSSSMVPLAMLEMVGGSLTSRIETVPEPSLATARSGLASPLKSPTATERGLNPTPTLGAVVKPPVPFPRRTERLLEVELDTARSGLASPLKSPTATEIGVALTTTSGAAVKPPAPSPRRTETVFVL